MYKAFWGMQFNPFTKEIETRHAFLTVDHEECKKRMEHLKNVKGIGVFTGLPGRGKTFAMRAFVDSLNQNLYRTVYLPLTTVPSGPFYRQLAAGLGLEPAYSKADNFSQIQERMRDMCRSQRITPVLIIDEAQYLDQKVLSDIKILMNFDMDSQSYAILMLTGHPELADRLSMKVNEALEQRVVISYAFQGLSREGTAAYVQDRMALSGVARDIFGPGALDGAAGASGGSIRRLNNLIHKALMIGCDQKAEIIDTEIIMKASDEISLL